MQVDAALDIVDKMCEAGYMVSTHMLQSILQICEETYDYILVRSIWHKAASLFFLCIIFYSIHFFAQYVMEILL